MKKLFAVLTVLALASSAMAWSGVLPGEGTEASEPVNDYVNPNTAVTATPGKVYVLEGGTINTDIDDSKWLLNLKGDPNTGLKFDMTGSGDACYVTMSYDWNISDPDCQNIIDYDYKYWNIGIGQPYNPNGPTWGGETGWRLYRARGIFSTFGSMDIAAYPQTRAKNYLWNTGISGGAWNEHQFTVPGSGDPTDPNDRTYVNDFSPPAVGATVGSFADDSSDGDYLNGSLPDGDHRSVMVAGLGSQPDANLGGYEPDWALLEFDGEDLRNGSNRVLMDFNNAVHDGVSIRDVSQWMVGIEWMGATLGTADMGDTILRDVLVVQGDPWGDSDLDGDIDLTDLTNLGSNFGLSSRTWAQGDTNGDGAVDLVDLTNLGSNYGFSGLYDNEFDSSQSIPEPATMALLAMGGLAVLRRRRK